MNHFRGLAWRVEPRKRQHRFAKRMFSSESRMKPSDLDGHAIRTLPSIQRQFKISGYVLFEIALNTRKRTNGQPSLTAGHDTALGPEVGTSF
jgi:hypothetical protein